MFRRVRDSLVYPKEILNYRKDKIIFVLFYLLFFALLLSTRTVIDVVTYDGLSELSKEAIIEEMTIVDNDCLIGFGQLICDGDHLIRVYTDTMYSVYLDSHQTIDYNEYPDNEYAIIINGEFVYVYLFGIEMLDFPITDFPASLQNIDFNQQISDPDGFYDNLFTGIDELVVSYKGMWGSMMIAAEIIVSMIFYLIFILFSSWFLKKRFSIIPYKEAFTLTVYSSTSLYIILTFYSMLNLNLLIVIVLLIISFRQNGIMSREIDRIIKKNLEK